MENWKKNKKPMFLGLTKKNAFRGAHELIVSASKTYVLSVRKIENRPVDFT